jgi:predicted transcriptional regulator
MRAVRQIIDRFCEGSAERLIAGMVDDEVLDPAQLRRLAREIDSKSRRRNPR